MEEVTPATCSDSGVVCLVMLARMHEVAANAEQLVHEFGSSSGNLDDTDLVRAARWLGLKARQLTSTPERVLDMPVPALARLKDGIYVILAGARDKRMLIRRHDSPASETWSRAEFEAQWSGSVVLLSRRAGLIAAPDQFDFSWFLPVILKYRKYLGEVLLASFFLQLFALITPLFFQVIIDKVLVHHGLTTLDILAAGLLIVSLFEVLLGGLRTYVFAHTTNRIDVALGSALFRHLLRLPMAYYEARRVGDTVARMRELETIRNFITGSSITVLVDAVFTLVFFGVMYLYSPWLTLSVAATLPLYALLAITLTPALRARLNEKFNRGADNQAFLVEAVTAIETLKAAAVEPATQRRWDERLAAYVAASFRTTQLSNIANQLAALINKLMVLGILWVGARQVIEGSLSVGQLVAFNMLAGRIAAPILRLTQLWQDFQQAGVSVQRLGDILNAHPEPAHSSARGSLPAIRGEICFDHVRFRYQPDAPEALSNFSLDVNAGEIVGVVGRSGSGKSTLAKLIQRLHVPERGRVLVDGVDLAMVDTAWLRRNIGVVLQDNVLLGRSVRENIALADPAMAMTRVVHAAKMAGAHEFILALPQGYDSDVGENGCTLSGGQRQRIAFARALITNPRILLLDEATSALDFESEAAIQRNMRYICKGRTVIIVAHRLSAVRQADRIIVLEQGRLIEHGTHAALRHGEGYYANLCRYQHAVSGSSGS